MSDDKRTHLQFIQNIISRLNGNSFSVKGWIITLQTGIYAVAISSKNSQLLFLSFFVVIVFWLIDSHFLYHEKLFRKLYDDVRLSEKDFHFSMNTVVYKKGVLRFKSFFSGTLLYFYFILILINLVVVYFYK